MMANHGSPFHRGERELQLQLGMRDKMERLGQRMIRDHMPEEHREFFSQLPLLLVGTVDAAGRPWASVLVGKPGFLDPTDAQTLKVRALPIYGDPLGKSIIEGLDIGALGLEFHTRRRNRVNGRITQVRADGFEIRVTQGFGNCPKYIQAREVELKDLEDALGTLGDARPVHRGKGLDRNLSALVARADTFFIASQFSEGGGDWTEGVDVSHRGGPPGFVLVAHETALLFPDYSGNCMFNTLGNLLVNPRCGLLFIDFDSGDTLQLTGEAEILMGPEHTERFPGARRVVSFRVEETLHIERALPVRWSFQSYSPVFEEFEEAEAGVPEEVERAPMTLLSVNVSMPKEVVHDGKTVTTGIFKKPIQGRVMLRRLNLEGDGQSDLWGHGGAFRAVLVYSIENYEYWKKELGRDALAGSAPDQRVTEAAVFGENFTVAGMLEDEVCVGDVYRMGGALVEVTQPRIPCFKLAMKMGIEGFQNRFLKSGRVGFYLRVLEEGEVGSGDTIELVRRDPGRMTVRQVSNLLYFDKNDLDGTRKALSVPALSHGWKGSFEERLDKAEVPVDDTASGFRSFRVDRKVPESETITSFYLVPEDGAPLVEFLPGQFLTFRLTAPGHPEPLIRTYSLSDSPGCGYYRVTIKRESAPIDRPDAPPGASSTYFHDQVKEDTTLLVGPPRGKFHLDSEVKRAVVLLSAGVGLTPLVSMLNTLAERGTTHPVWFLHGARNGREHALGAHVRRLAEKTDNIRVHVRYSRPGPDDVEGRDYDSLGHLDIALLKQVLPFDDYDFYLCGPTPFLKSLVCGLLSLGISAERIHYEFFGPAVELSEQARPSGQAAERTAEEELAGAPEVTFSRSGVTAAWDPACESILDLAEREGLSPAFSCRSGICNTCKCTLVEGEVDYFEEPLVTPDPGSVLICCSRPKGPLVIEI